MCVVHIARVCQLVVMKTLKDYLFGGDELESKYYCTKWDQNLCLVSQRPTLTRTVIKIARYMPHVKTSKGVQTSGPTG